MSKIWTAVSWVGALDSSVPDFDRLLSPLETTGLELLLKRAAQQRLLDQFCLPQKRGEPKGQLTRDCSTGLDPNRNGENQQQLTGDCSTSFGHSTQREDNQQQLTGDCSTSFGHSTQREDNQPLTQHGRGRGGRSHVVNEIQEHTDGVPPSCISRPGCSSTSFNLSRTQSRGDRPTHRGQLLNDKGETLLTTGNRLTTQLPSDRG